MRLSFNCDDIFDDSTIPKGYDEETYFNWFNVAYGRLCHYFSFHSFPASFGGILLGQTYFFVSLMAFYFVRRNQRIGGWVKTLLLANVTLRAGRALAEIYFATCIMSLHCLSVDGYPWSGIFLNQLVSAFYLAAQISIQWLEHVVTLSRYFAVSHDGLYYHLFSKWETLQVAVIVVLPLIMYSAPIPTVIHLYADLYTFGGYLYNVNLFGTYEKPFGTFIDTLINMNLYMLAGICVLALLVDIATLIKLRKRMETNTTDFKQARADTRLSVQMLVTHSINIFDWIKVFLTHNLDYNILQFLGDAYQNLFLVVLFTGFAESLLQSFVIIYFNRGKQEKAVSIEVSQVDYTRKKTESSRLNKSVE